MEVTFYKEERGSEALLLFFTGWGTTPEVAKHLSLPVGWDYCAFHDYRDLSTPLPRFREYQKVYLLGWSMGVWAADRLAGRLPKVDRAVAINGTPVPMHDVYGIPIAHFEGTLRNLDEMNREKFDRRMVGGKKLLEVYKTFHARSTEDLKSELQGVYDQVKGISDTEALTTGLEWTKALISERDLIVPPANQRAFWDAAGVETELLAGEGHYPFLSYSSWEGLLFSSRL